MTQQERPLILRGTMIALLFVGVFGFAALIWLSAFAPDLRNGSDGGAHALSRSAVGYAGLARLLESGHAKVHVSRGADELHRARLVILTPGAPISEGILEQRQALAPTLVVLPKWRALPHPERPGWAMNMGTLNADQLTEVVPFAGGIEIARREIRGRPSLAVERPPIPPDPQSPPNQIPTAFETPIRLGAIASFQTIEGEMLTPLVVDDEGRTVLAQWGKDWVYILSDPDLLNTQGMADFETARAAAALIDLISDTDGPIIFDATVNGFARSRNPLKLVLEPPFLAVTLCLIAAALLAGWQAMARFGPPAAQARTFDYGKKALADNSAALIRLGRREHEMGESYARLTRELAARAVGAPRTMPDEELSAHLDRIAKQAKAEKSLAALLEEASQAANSARLLSAARALYFWKRGVVRADR